jgi:hypothetical protein
VHSGFAFELRKNAEIEPFGDSEKSGNALRQSKTGDAVEASPVFRWKGRLFG